jgi:hypothetical protein
VVSVEGRNNQGETGETAGKYRLDPKKQRFGELKGKIGHFFRGLFSRAGRTALLIRL